MLSIHFRYKDKLSKGKWNYQECIVSSIDEYKKIYGLDIDCDEYEILNVIDLESTEYKLFVLNDLRNLYRAYKLSNKTDLDKTLFIECVINLLEKLENESYNHHSD